MLEKSTLQSVAKDTIVSKTVESSSLSGEDANRAIVRKQQNTTEKDEAKHAVRDATESQPFRTAVT